MKHLAQGRIQPQHVEAEQAVLGAVLLTEKSAQRFEEFLRGDATGADIFYKEQHRLIAIAIFEVIRTGANPDYITVSAKLRDKGELELAGGVYYLTELTAKVASDANLQFHMQEVTTAYFRRQLIKQGEKMMADGYSEETDAFDAKDDAIEALEQIASVFIHGTAKPVGEEMVEEIQLLKIKADKWRAGLAYDTEFSTGFANLDFVTNGYAPHTAWLTGAHSSQGKTSFMLSSALAGAKVGVPTLIKLFEITKKNARLRLISMITGLSLRKIVRGTLQKDEERLLEIAKKYLAGLPLWMEECGKMEPGDIISLWKQYRRKHGIAVAWGDYIQLLRQLKTIRGFDANNTQTVAYMAQRTREFVSSSQWPMCVHWLSQFNQDVKKRANMTPQQGDFAGSKVLYESATHAGGLYRPGHYEHNTPGYYDSVHPTITPEILDKSINYHLMKQSDGPLDVIPLEWVANQTKVVMPKDAGHLISWGAGVMAQAYEIRPDYEKMLRKAEVKNLDRTIISYTPPGDDADISAPATEPDGKGFPF